jgi:hypothetical protein
MRPAPDHQHRPAAPPTAHSGVSGLLRRGNVAASVDDLYSMDEYENDEPSRRVPVTIGDRTILIEMTSDDEEEVAGRSLHFADFTETLSTVANGKVTLEWSPEKTTPNESSS